MFWVLLVCEQALRGGGRGLRREGTTFKYFRLRQPSRTSHWKFVHIFIIPSWDCTLFNSYIFFLNFRLRYQSRHVGSWRSWNQCKRPHYNNGRGRKHLRDKAGWLSQKWLWTRSVSPLKVHPVKGNPDSGIWELSACRIRNPKELFLVESGILGCGIQNIAQGIRNPESH